MDQKFLMGQSDGLVRSQAVGPAATTISPAWRARLTTAAMQAAFDFYRGFFGKQAALDVARLAEEYQHAFAEGVSLGLLGGGGIREKDHLNLWCLARVLRPDVYVESGVYTGSSLHAFLRCPGINIIGIDPDLTNLRLPVQLTAGVQLINDRDFSQLDLSLSGSVAVAYFDDHIDSAARILQAAARGIRYVLFDDSNGLEGICQRLYPAVPTVPMIMNVETMSPGDELSWVFAGKTRVTLAITRPLIESCIRAKSLITKCSRIPDLGEFIPQANPEKTADTTKYLLELAVGKP